MVRYQRHILIADENAAHRDGLERFLSGRLGAGFQVKQVGTAEAYFAAINSDQRYALIILTDSFPGLNAREELERISRWNGNTRNRPPTVQMLNRTRHQEPSYDLRSSFPVLVRSDPLIKPGDMNDTSRPFFTTLLKYVVEDHLRSRATTRDSYGIIGTGAIGSSLAHALAGQKRAAAERIFLYNSGLGEERLRDRERHLGRAEQVKDSLPDRKGLEVIVTDNMQDIVDHCGIVVHVIGYKQKEQNLMVREKFAELYIDENIRIARMFAGFMGNIIPVTNPVDLTGLIFDQYSRDTGSLLYVPDGWTHPRVEALAALDQNRLRKALRELHGALVDRKLIKCSDRNGCQKLGGEVVGPHNEHRTVLSADIHGLPLELLERGMSQQARDLRLTYEAVEATIESLGKGHVLKTNGVTVASETSGQLMRHVFALRDGKDITASILMDMFRYTDLDPDSHEGSELKRAYPFGLVFQGWPVCYNQGKAHPQKRELARQGLKGDIVRKLVRQRNETVRFLKKNRDRFEEDVGPLLEFFGES